MCDHDHCFVASLAEGIDNVFDELAVCVVETMKGFVKNEELGVFDKGSGKKYQALLST